MIIYQKPGYLTIEYNQEKNYTLATYENQAIQLRDLKESQFALIKVLEEKNVKTTISDTSNAKGVFFKECNEWLANDFIPKYANKTKVERIITITPKTSLGKISNKLWKQQIEPAISETREREFIEVDSLEEAIKYAV